MDLFHLPFDDGTVDLIFTEHMLEHLGKHEVALALEEWARVLKPYGKLLMNLPNLEWCLEQWLSKPEKERWDWQLDTIFGLQTHPGEFHKTGFTQERLGVLLTAAGFGQILMTDFWSHGQSCFWIEAMPANLSEGLKGFNCHGSGWCLSATRGCLTIPGEAVPAGTRVQFELSIQRPVANDQLPLNVRISVHGRNVGQISFTTTHDVRLVEITPSPHESDIQIAFESVWPEMQTGRKTVAMKKRPTIRLEALKIVEAADDNAIELSCTPVPLVSIVVVVDDDLEGAQRCISAVKSRTPDGLSDLIVVDNGSSNVMTEMLKTLANKAAIVRTEQPVGLPAAFNQGAIVSKRKYLVFLDSRDEPQPGWLTSLLKTAEGGSDIGAVGSRHIFPNGCIRESGGIVFSNGAWCQFGYGKSVGDDIFGRPIEVDYCSAGCLLIRRDLFLRYGGFDERYESCGYPEIDLCFGLRRMRYKVVLSAAANIHHQKNGRGNCQLYPRMMCDPSSRLLNLKWKNELNYQPAPPENLNSAPQTADRSCRRVVCQ
jgi:GT2 family glycosyltransferase